MNKRQKEGDIVQTNDKNRKEKAILCPRCGEFFFYYDKFPICRKCQYEDVIILGDDILDGWNSAHGFKNKDAYEESLREKYVYDNPAFSKVAYNQRIQADEAAESAANEKTRALWREHPGCPKCFSHNTVIQQKGFSTGKAVAGALLTGNLIGSMAGFIGSGKVQVKCLNCGHTWSEVQE